MFMRGSFLLGWVSDSFSAFWVWVFFEIRGADLGGGDLGALTRKVVREDGGERAVGRLVGAREGRWSTMMGRLGGDDGKMRM